MRRVQACRQGPDLVLLTVGDDIGVSLSHGEARLVMAMLSGVTDEPPRPPTTYVRPLDPPHVRHDADSPLLPRKGYLDSGPINPEDDGA